jgi:hypothetical protein
VEEFLAEIYLVGMRQIPSLAKEGTGMPQVCCPCVGRRPLLLLLPQ